MTGMMTVSEVSKLTGVSIRTLQYYDKIGLLHATMYTESGYRLYDDTALEVLQQILLFRELEFPLKEIKEIISSPGFDKTKALEQQIELLTMKKDHLERLIRFAREIQSTGGKCMDFSAFDKKKMDEYAKRAKEQWGATAEYQESVEKAKGRTEDEEQKISAEFMKLFREFGAMKGEDPSDAKVQDQVKKLQTYICEHFYNCTNQILSGLGQMYACGGEFTENIDREGGEGTAVFAAEAIQIYCGKQH